MAGFFCEPSRRNPTKVSKPGLAPKVAGLGFFAFSVFWGHQSGCLPFFDGLDFPITRRPFYIQTVTPWYQGEGIRAIPGTSSIFRPSFIVICIFHYWFFIFNPYFCTQTFLLTIIYKVNWREYSIRAIFYLLDLVVKLSSISFQFIGKLALPLLDDIMLTVNNFSRPIRIDQ